jgi:hypothetical protein
VYRGYNALRLQPYNLCVKNSKTQGPDEGDFYRTLVQVLGSDDDPKALETEVPTAPTKPPMTVGAYKLRQRLRLIVDKVGDPGTPKNQ